MQYTHIENYLRSSGVGRRAAQRLSSDQEGYESWDSYGYGTGLGYAYYA